MENNLALFCSNILRQLPVQADEIQVAIYIFCVCKMYVHPVLFYSPSADDVETITTRDQGNVYEN